MKATWIGQAGLIFESGSTTVLIDPYLSNSVAATDPSKSRRVDVDPKIFSVQPDVMIFTHDHLDHYDPQTAQNWLSRCAPITVLAPTSVWSRVRKFGGRHNYVQFNCGTQWTQGDFLFTAVKAEHSDPCAIGVVLTAEGRNHYITGDTLFNTAIFPTLPAQIDTVYLPVNGVGNNMNMRDAARFAQHIGANWAVPLHIGMFDDLNAEDFPFPNKRIPTIYEEITL